MGSGQNWFVGKSVKLCRHSERRQVRHFHSHDFMGLCVCSATLWFYWVGASISLSGVCWCLVPTQFIQIIETGNNSTVKCHRKLKKALKKNKIVYAVCVDLRKCREVLFQVSMFMMYTACAGGFLAATLTSHVCKSLMHQPPPQSFCTLFAFLLTAFSEQHQDFFRLCCWGRKWLQ